MQKAYELWVENDPVIRVQCWSWNLPEPPRACFLARSSLTSAEKPVVVVAALPILLPLVLLVGLGWPAVRAMPLCAVVSLLSAWLLWEVPVPRLAAVAVEAIWITVSVLFIVFGALFFLELLRSTGAVAVLQRTFGGLSTDARIQAVLMGWVMGSFLEGAAGFGTPAAITAPLLIGLGFPPIQAVVVALVGDSTAVSFGAVGTPMIIGMGQGLAPAENAPTVEEISSRVAAFDLILGTHMPAVVVMVLVLSAEGRRGWWPGLRATPFALAVGLVQALVSGAVAVLLGPEFPSLLGPAAGFFTAVVLLRTGAFVPREEWRVGVTETRERNPEGANLVYAGPTPVAAFAPYLLLLTLLVLTRTQALPVGSWLSDIALKVNDLFGSGISARWEPFSSPGTIFVICAAASAIWLRADRQQLSNAALTASGVTQRTAIALIGAITTVRGFVHSGVNAAGLESMPLVLADSLTSMLGGVWPVVAPRVGALGAFVAGSATFSNMLFALVQLKVATPLGLDPVSVLALQAVGAAAGNMVCVHNVVAACAVAGILRQEGAVIRLTAPPMIAYLIVAGLIGTVTS